MRKIIQIAVESQPDSPSWNSFYTVTALCDDGTVWELDFTRETQQREWHKVPDIQQE